MILRKALHAASCLLLLEVSLANAPSTGLRNGRKLVTKCGENYSDDADECGGSVVRQSSSAMAGVTGDRVSELDLSDATCYASTSNPNTGTSLTQVKYYYKVEADETISEGVLPDLEGIIFAVISTGVLWCTSEAVPSIDVGDGGRLLKSEALTGPRFLEFTEGSRRISVEEARRMSIISFNAGPNDGIESSRFSGDSDPCKDSTYNSCEVVEGAVSIVAHKNDNLEIVIASVLDSTQRAMEAGLIVDAVEEVGLMFKNVTWLGATEEEVVALVAGAGAGGATSGGGGGGVVVGDPTVNRGIENPEPQSENDVPGVVYAAIPMALLLFLALLLAKNKRRREVMTAADMRALEEDYVIVGTGDPPRAFHEGMYHYTRSGARYLSTNCPDCAETRRIGFFTDADLATITEDQLYDPASPSGECLSFDENSADGGITSKASSQDSSHRRKRTLVIPSENTLGKKHSAIDVHQCTSATCRICTYRPADVAFVSSPVASPASTMFASNTNESVASPASTMFASNTTEYVASPASTMFASNTTESKSRRNDDLNGNYVV